MVGRWRLRERLGGIRESGIGAVHCLAVLPTPQKLHCTIFYFLPKSWLRDDFLKFFYCHNFPHFLGVRYRHNSHTTNAPKTTPLLCDVERHVVVLISTKSPGRRHPKTTTAALLDRITESIPLSCLLCCCHLGAKVDTTTGIAI